MWILKHYDLEDRTALFAKRVRALAKRLPRTTGNSEDCRQVLRSSGSIGANYIEANESLGKGDCVMHLKICRREAKETRYWLEMLDLGEDTEMDRLRQVLVQESTELMNIFAAIVRKIE
jgi:four helix bundle protein